MPYRKVFAAIGLAVPLLLGAQTPRAQDGIKRTDLQTHDLSIPGREVIQQMVELTPGAVVPRHTHPGEEVSVILDGELLLEIAGKASTTLKAGQAFTVPMGAVHGVKNASRAPVKLLVTYIVEKGKPLRSPAP
jgi:quercetin dioxygenase-like cupin family protein